MIMQTNTLALHMIEQLFASHESLFKKILIIINIEAIYFVYSHFTQVDSTIYTKT